MLRKDEHRAPKYVLLVDDEPLILLALKILVEMHGWMPLVARSGSEALALVERADAVVTDFSMPEMDGLELLHAIRRGGRSTPVIILTAHSSERLARRARQEGACDVVAKPFDIDAMAVAIARALGARSSDARR
jgi:two-component system, NtrC family, response regulator AtoC